MSVMDVFLSETSMSYYFSKQLEMPFAQALQHVTEALAGKGFGVLTTIDVRATMKKKLDIDFRPDQWHDPRCINTPDPRHPEQDPCLSKGTRRDQLLCMMTRDIGCRAQNNGSGDPSAWSLASIPKVSFEIRDYSARPDGRRFTSIRAIDAHKDCDPKRLLGRWTNTSNRGVILDVTESSLRFSTTDQKCLKRNDECVQQLKAFAADHNLSEKDVLHELRPAGCGEVTIATVPFPGLQKGEGPCEWYVQIPYEVEQDGGVRETFVKRCDIFVGFGGAGLDTPDTNKDDFLQTLLTFQPCIPGEEEFAAAAKRDDRLSVTVKKNEFEQVEKADFHRPPPKKDNSSTGQP
jgi:hypothetical protein